jgi:hypothetical protein
MKKLARHVREADQIIQRVAVCTLCSSEGLAAAERAVRAKIRLSSLQNFKPEVVILREMWQELLNGKAHRVMNKMIKEERIVADSFEDFDRKKEVLRTFQRRARHWQKTKYDYEHGLGDFAGN